jgi:tetratricopeptide (TPR) repeat protein
MTKPAPYSGWEHIMRSLLYIKSGGTDSSRRAIEEGRQAVTAAPDLGLTHAVLASAISYSFTSAGAKLDTLRDELQTHIERALQLDGDNPAVINLLVFSYIPLGEGDASLRLARRMVEMRPNSPYSHFTLGAALLNQGLSSDAIAAFTRQLEFRGHDRDRAHGSELLGWCCILEGMPEIAREALNKSLALVPDGIVPLRFKAIVEGRLGDENAAIATIRRIRSVEPTMSLGKHIGFLRLNPHLRERLAEHIETFRRLWAATGGDG